MPLVREECKVKGLGGGYVGSDCDNTARLSGSYSTWVEVYDQYGLSISFRRGSNSETQNRGVSDRDINHNNRWRKVKRAGARKLKLRMREHYTAVLVSLKSFLRYS